MNNEDELLFKFSKKQFNFILQYPSVLRRFLHVVKRAVNACNVEDVNEVGINCRELMNDYAKQIYSPEYSEKIEKNGNTKQLLKDTINYYTSSGREWAVVSSLNSLVDTVCNELNSITHASNVYPEHALLCINLCLTLIVSIESLILISKYKESPIYKQFGVIKCPKCKSLKLEASSELDEEHDEMYYFIKCKECGWSEWTQ